MEQKNQVQITISPEVAVGKYSNLAIIGHSETEFILDFAAALPGAQGPQVVSRVIMTPEHAKRLLGALQDNIQKYESQFGAIHVNNGAPQMPMGFGGEA